MFKNVFSTIMFRNIFSHFYVKRLMIGIMEGGGGCVYFYHPSRQNFSLTRLLQFLTLQPGERDDGGVVRGVHRAHVPRGARLPPPLPQNKAGLLLARWTGFNYFGTFFDNDSISDTYQL